MTVLVDFQSPAPPYNYAPGGPIIPGGLDAASNTQYGDWLSIRHDRTAHYPMDVYVPGRDTMNIPNTSARGNAGFCDGHVDYVTRGYAQASNLRHWDPTN
jgi:prepilin-type processing-associated H-X9-DG protein